MPATRVPEDRIEYGAIAPPLEEYHDWGIRYKQKTL